MNYRYIITSALYNTQHSRIYHRQELHLVIRNQRPFWKANSSVSKGMRAYSVLHFTNFNKAFIGNSIFGVYDKSNLFASMYLIAVKMNICAIVILS